MYYSNKREREWFCAMDEFFDCEMLKFAAFFVSFLLSGLWRKIMQGLLITFNLRVRLSCPM